MINLHRSPTVQCVWKSDGNNKHFNFNGVCEVFSSDSDTLRGDRPHMTLYAGSDDSDSVEALFDTGAVTSVLSTDAFKWFKDRGAVRRQVDTAGLSLTAANGSPLKMEGAHVIRFRFRNTTMEGVFVTVPTLSSRLIVGMNIIRPNLLTVSPGTIEVVAGKEGDGGIWSGEINTVGQDRKWTQAQILVHKAVSLLEQTATRVRCKLALPDHGDRLVGPNTPFIGHVMGMPIHACTDSKGFCHLFLPNTTHETIHLARSEVVGLVDNHAMWDRAALTSEVAAVIFKQRAQDRGLQPTAG